MKYMTPNQAWDTYVGNESVADFIAYVVDVYAYASHSPMLEGLSHAEREQVADLLQEYIDA